MTEKAVVAGYDHIVFDLDGVLILGDQPVTGAADAVAGLRQTGVSLSYATNNASRSAEQVADLLTGLGIPAKPSEVVTSARAAAAVLAERFPPGARVLVVGSEALAAEVRLVGLRPVTTATDEPVAVVQGYSWDVGWQALAEASIAIRAGALWVATNLDRTLPSPRGPLPGNGALVSALATALERRPDLAVGKPSPDLFSIAAGMSGGSKSLVVGDRLDTDIEGANRAGLDSVLVLTGVSTPADLLAAGPGRRPTFVAWDVGGLVREPNGAIGGWLVRGDQDGLELAGDGPAVDALWALCQTWWSAQEAHQAHQPHQGDAPCGTPKVVARGTRANTVLRRLGLG
jgi:HAD superfamily hydrolase (TIGR01450 family)